MDANHQHLPYELVDLIIDFASDPSFQTADCDTLPKQTLLVCALVCKTWLWPARRRFLSLYFEAGVVKLLATPQAFLKFHDAFNSPLCTLDPTFIRVLNIQDWLYSRATVIFPFSTLLSILTEISLPSLRTIRLENIEPNFDRFNVEYDDDDTSYCVTPVVRATMP